MKDKLTKFLEDNVWARERRHKNLAIFRFTQSNEGEDLVHAILGADRLWRQILSDRKDLRGTDYDKKEVLSQEAQLNLGYIPGYNGKLF